MTRMEFVSTDLNELTFSVHNSKYSDVAYVKQTSYGGFGLFAKQVFTKLIKIEQNYINELLHYYKIDQN